MAFFNENMRTIGMMLYFFLNYTNDSVLELFKQKSVALTSGVKVRKKN